MKKYLFILVGVAFFSLLTFNNASATSFGVNEYSTDLQFNISCNSVSSEKGYLVLGNRGSLFTNSSTISNEYPCNYRNTDNGFRPFGSQPVPGVLKRFNSSGVVSSVNDNANAVVNGIRSLFSDNSYISSNFKTTLWRINPVISSLQVPAISGENYSSNMLVITGLIPDNHWKNFGIPDFIPHINGNLTWSRGGSSLSFSTTEVDTFISDLYLHSYSNLGNPKDYITDSMYDLLKQKYSIDSDDNVLWNRMFYFVGFLPQYSDSYSLTNLEFGCGDLCSSAYPSDLKFDGLLGMNHDDSWTSDFLTISNSYTKDSYPNTNGRFKTDNYTHFMTHVVYAQDSEAQAILSALAKKAAIDGYNQTAGWNDVNYNNPGTSWWSGIFNLGGIFFPFANFFSGFTNNQCVSIPVLAGMLHSPSNQYCSWWSSSIRNVLTPVFNVASLMLIFGFIMNWLRKDDSDVLTLKEGSK